MTTVLIETYIKGIHYIQMYSRKADRIGISLFSCIAEKTEKLNIKFRLAKEGEMMEGGGDGTTFHLLLEPGSEGTDTKDKKKYEEQEEKSSSPSGHCSASQDGSQPACGSEPNHKPEADP